MIKKGLITIGTLAMLGFAVLQVMALSIPEFSRSNPPVTYDIQWDSVETEQLVRAACYDCHSNETVYPWYSYVAPTAFLVADHVNEGREALNFSTGRGEFEAEEMIEEIRHGAMPPQDYELMHPQAQLSDAEARQLIAGIEATFNGGRNSGLAEGGERGERGEHDDDD